VYVGVLVFLAAMVGVVVVFSTPGLMEAILFDPRLVATVGGGAALVWALFRPKTMWFLRLQRPRVFWGLAAVGVGALFLVTGLPSVLVAFGPHVAIDAGVLRAVRLNATDQEFKVGRGAG
jgi:hypothetical protein